MKGALGSLSREPRTCGWGWRWPAQAFRLLGTPKPACAPLLCKPPPTGCPSVGHSGCSGEHAQGSQRKGQAGRHLGQSCLLLEGVTLESKPLRFPRTTCPEAEESSEVTQLGPGGAPLLPEQRPQGARPHPSEDSGPRGGRQVSAQGGGVLLAWGGGAAAALGLLLAIQRRPPSLQAPSPQAWAGSCSRPSQPQLWAGSGPSSG